MSSTEVILVGVMARRRALPPSNGPLIAARAPERASIACAHMRWPPTLLPPSMADTPSLTTRP